jgi:hypothetical protein
MNSRDSRIGLPSTRVGATAVIITQFKRLKCTGLVWLSVACLSYGFPRKSTKWFKN